MVAECVDSVFDGKYYNLENRDALVKVIADGMLVWESNLLCFVEELGFPYPPMINERKRLDYELKCISIVIDGVVSSMYDALLKRDLELSRTSSEELAELDEDDELRLSETEFADRELNSIGERYELPYYHLKSCHDDWSDWTWEGDFVYDYLKKPYQKAKRGTAKWEELEVEGMVKSFMGCGAY